MKRLQTYVALLVTIFTLVAGMVASFGVAALGTQNPIIIVWIVLLVATFSLVISLVIGHYLAEPLATLHRKTAGIINGDTRISIAPDGRLHEADQLARDVATLTELSKTQLTDLTVQQKRQTQFISDVAHELRTPLTAIRGTAETLADPDMPASMRERFSQTIVSEAERLTRLCNDLLTLQHIEDGTDQTSWQRVNLRTVAANVADAMEPLVEESGGTLAVEGEAPDVLGNPDRLQQVVYNLVSNATRFIGPGGHIRIKLEGVDGQSIISVTDDGPGFGDVDPKMLFTRFYRGDNSRARNTGGTGLGLSIVKSIVEMHDGTVEAFNAAEGGACFMVAIPSIREVMH